MSASGWRTSCGSVLRRAGGRQATATSRARHEVTDRATPNLRRRLPSDPAGARRHRVLEAKIPPVAGGKQTNPSPSSPSPVGGGPGRAEPDALTELGWSHSLRIGTLPLESIVA